MALDTFIAGRYSGTYNSNDVGITRDGYRLFKDSAWEEISETDAFGMSLLDGVYRGGRCSIQFDSKAYKTGSIAAFWPWGSLGVLATAAAPIARLASAVAAATVLTDVDNTPAAGSPATLTASLSILAPNQNADLLFSSRVREVPVRLSLLPSTSTGTTTWFTTT